MSHATCLWQRCRWPSLLVAFMRKRKQKTLLCLFARAKLHRAALSLTSRKINQSQYLEITRRDLYNAAHNEHFPAQANTQMHNGVFVMPLKYDLESLNTLLSARQSRKKKAHGIDYITHTPVKCLQTLDLVAVWQLLSQTCQEGPSWLGISHPDGPGLAYEQRSPLQSWGFLFL